MRFKVVGDFIGIILILFSGTFILPIIVGLIYNEPKQFLLLTYGLPLILTLAIGIGLWYVTARELPTTARDREAFVAVGLCWLIVALLGAIPYVLSGVLPNFIDAYFESMSGFTTCGATVLDPKFIEGGIENCPRSLLFWRALTQWLGGLGIIVLCVIVLARVLGPSGAAHLYKAEISGHIITRLRPRLQQTAVILWGVYLLFTTVEIILLYLAGISLFDAITHTFTTIATGGFSTKNNSIGAFHNPLVESIIVVFMILSGINFVVHYRALSNIKQRKFSASLRCWLNEPEVRFYFLLLTFGTILISADLILHAVYSSADAFRYAIFQVVSIHTTTGFTTADFGSWPTTSQFLLLILMSIGGCVGSTAGGVKVIRLLILAKIARREIYRLIHPRGLLPVSVGGHKLDDEALHNITQFFFIYFALFIISTIILTILGLDMVSAIAGSASTLGVTGPALGTLGPTYTFASVHPLGKILLSICMWFGRLEIFACIVIFFPSTYRR